MKKKILCCLIVFVMAFAGFPANAHILEGNVNKVIDKLAEFTPADRENLLTMAFPFVTVDSGINIIVSMIKNHNPMSDGMIDEYIGKILEHTTKEDATFALSSLKVIPEEIRKQIFSDYMERKEYPLSDNGNGYMSDFLKIAYTKNPSIEKIIVADNITNGTIANVFRGLYLVNDSRPLVSVNGQYVFAPLYISESVADNWDAIRASKSGTESLRQMTVAFVNNLNDDYSYDMRMKIASLFSETGLCEIPQDINTSSESFKNISIGASDKMKYNAVFAYAENGKLLYKTQTLEKAYPRINFSDCKGWYASSVAELAYMGIVSGRGDGLFYPNDYVTREEFVKMICAAINMPKTATKAPFVDMDSSAWYAEYINSAYEYGIIKGRSSEIFGVGDYITRQDAAVICSNVLKDMNIVETDGIVFGDSYLVAPYAAESVNKLSALGILKGNENGYFNPGLNITRAESAKIINELIYLIVNTK